MGKNRKPKIEQVKDICKVCGEEVVLTLNGHTHKMFKKCKCN